MDDQLLKALTMQSPADPGLGESAVHHREPDDLVALTVEAAAMAGCRQPAPAGFPGGATAMDPAGQSAPFMI